MYICSKFPREYISYTPPYLGMYFNIVVTLHRWVCEVNVPRYGIEGVVAMSEDWNVSSCQEF